MTYHRGKKGELAQRKEVCYYLRELERDFMLDKKSDFLRVYSNIPLPLRKEIIYVENETGPLSWDVVFIEVENETALGAKILDKLKAMEII